MALAFDAVGPGSTGSTSSGSSPLTWAHTCTGTGLVLYVGVAVDAGTSDAGVTVSATYNSVSMTSVLRWHSGGSGQAVGFIEVFRLIAPATGSNTVSVTFSGGTGVDKAHGGSVSFTGADQTTGNGTAVHADSNNASVTSGSISVTGTTSGNIVAGFAANGSGGTSFTTGTLRWAGGTGGSGAAGFSAGATNTSAGGTVSVAWNQTSDFYGAVAFEVLASGASASAPAAVAVAAGTAPDADTVPHAVNAGPNYAGAASDVGGAFGLWVNTQFATGPP